MKFYIPHASSDKEAASVWSSIKSFAEENTGWKCADSKIQGIEYRHDGKHYTATVGSVEPRTGEEVIAILASTTFLVCTPNRGVLRGDPMMVGRDEAYSVTLFDGERMQREH